MARKKRQRRTSSTEHDADRFTDWDQEGTLEVVGHEGETIEPIEPIEPTE